MKKKIYIQRICYPFTTKCIAENFIEDSPDIICNEQIFSLYDCSSCNKVI